MIPNVTRNQNSIYSYTFDNLITPLYKKLENFLLNKINPLRNDKEITKNIKKTRNKEKFLNAIKTNTEKKIKNLNNLIITAPSKTNQFEEKKEILINQKNRIEKACQTTKETIDYYEKQNTEEIKGRFAGMIAKVPEAIIPGAGLVTEIGWTIKSMAAKENLVNTLPQNSPQYQAEKQKIRKKTIITIGVKVLVISLSILSYNFFR